MVDSASNRPIAYFTGALSLLIVVNVVSVAQFLKYGSPATETLAHLALAQQYLESGWLRELPWQPTADQAAPFYNPFLLAHGILAAWIAVLGDPLLAGAVAVVVSFVFTLFCLGVVLEKFDVRFAFLWPLLVLGASCALVPQILDFFGTSLLAGPWVLSLWLVLERRWWPLFAVSWLSVYLCDRSLLLLLVALSFVAATALCERTLEWKALVAVLAGIMAGLVVNPFWPHQWSYGMSQLVGPLFNARAAVFGDWPAAAEMSTAEHWRNAFLPIVVAGGTAVVQFISGRKLSTRAVFLWFLTGCLYALCLVAGSLFDFLLLAELLAVAVTLRELEVSLRSPLARVALGLVVLASVGNLGSGFLRLREESSLRLTVASDQDLVAVLQSQVFHRAPAGEGAQVAPMPAQPAVPAEPPQPMPDALDEQLAQAVKLLDGRQYPAAKSAFEAVLKAAEPANRPQARLLATVGLAESHLKTGDSKAALSLIEVTEKDLAAQFRKPPVDFFKLALIKALAQESLQDRAAAIDTLKKALDLAAMAYPQDHTLRWFVADRLSRMLEASGKNDEALRIVKMSIEPFQKDPSVTEQRRALWKERQERLQKAADRPQ